MSISFLKFKYYQGLAVLSVLNFRRVSNFASLCFSYFLSRIIRRPAIIGMPYAVSVEPSGLCNLKCPECPTGAAVLTRSGGMITPRMFTGVAASLEGSLMHVNLFFQGEPLLNRSLGELIRIATDHKLYTLLSTNGQLMNSRVAAEIVAGGLKEIIFSVDGLTQETYQRYRVGGRLDRVTAAIRKVADQKLVQKSNYPLITVQFLAFKHNEHEIPGLKSYTASVGADRYVVKSAQFNDFGDGSVKPPSGKRWKRYVDGTSFKPTRYRHCWRQWSSAVVGWDGAVIPCCYDKDGKYSFGRIDDSSDFPSLWNGESANSFRSKVLNAKYEIDICRNCPVGRGFW